MVLLASANFLAAAAPGYWAMLVSRVLVGVVIGGFWSVGAGLADRLVPAGSTRQATAVISSAVPLGSVLGVPLGTPVGDLAGWRASFAVMGVLSTAVLAALAVLVRAADDLSRRPGAFRRLHVRDALSGAGHACAVGAHGVPADLRARRNTRQFPRGRGGRSLSLRRLRCRRGAHRDRHAGLSSSRPMGGRRHRAADRVGRRLRRSSGLLADVVHQVRPAGHAG
nr:MFS transporter [Actinomadura meyerae]